MSFTKLFRPLVLSAAVALGVLSTTASADARPPRAYYNNGFSGTTFSAPFVSGYIAPSYGYNNGFNNWSAPVYGGYNNFARPYYAAPSYNYNYRYGYNYNSFYNTPSTYWGW